MTPFRSDEQRTGTGRDERDCDIPDSVPRTTTGVEHMAPCRAFGLAATSRAYGSPLRVSAGLPPDFPLHVPISIVGAGISGTP
jgi:hypothetical protein